MRSHDSAGGLLDPLESRVLFDSVPTAVLAYAGMDEHSKPAVFERMTDQSWSVVTLTSIPGAPADLTDPVAWVDSDNGRSFAAAVSAQGLFLFTRSDDGVWGQRNLTESIPGAEPIADELHFMQDGTGAFFLVGFTAEGDAVRYALGNDSARWTFRNITAADLVPTGQLIPELVSAIAPYSTSWNGLNAAGIAPDGQVWSIWWAPGRDHWATSNLSEITGTGVKFQGNPTVYTTAWGGINIAGVAEDGHLHVVWWVPEFGGEWRESDLTEQIGGPMLDGQSISSYTTDWGGLNVAGVDAASRRVVQYWWAPGMATWSSSELSAATESIPTITNLTGVPGTDQSLNLLMTGRTAGNKQVVGSVSWSPGQSSWTQTDLLEQATPLKEKFGITENEVYKYGYEYAADFGTVITGPANEALKSQFYDYYQLLLQAYGNGLSSGNAFWYETEYQGKFAGSTGEWFNGPDGPYYDPDYYADDPVGSSPNKMDFGNHPGPAVPGTQSVQAGSLLLNGMFSEQFNMSAL